MKTGGWIVIGIFVLWIIFGDPKGTVAGWFWSDSVAPWENVHAFYYPDADNLTVDRRKLDVGSLEACRDWVDEQTRADGDPMQRRSDYECGVGCRAEYGDMYVCRLTIR